MATFNITKIGVQQYAHVGAALAGVTFVYVSRNGESAVNISGNDFTPADNTQEEVWRVWKNALKLHWDVALIVCGLKKDNGGIAAKLRTSTPEYIIIRTAKGEVAFKWTKATSVFDRVGIMPTKADIDEVEKERKETRDYAKKMHRAAAASFNALKMKFTFKAAKADENAEESK